LLLLNPPGLHTSPTWRKIIIKLKASSLQQQEQQGNTLQRQERVKTGQSRVCCWLRSPTISSNYLRYKLTFPPLKPTTSHTAQTPLERWGCGRLFYEFDLCSTGNSSYLTYFFFRTSLTLSFKLQTQSNPNISQILTFKIAPQLGMVVHMCYPSTQEAEAGESQVPVQPGLHRDSVSKKKKQNTEKLNK
jgi:hypothetical protein